MMRSLDLPRLLLHHPIPRTLSAAPTQSYHHKYNPRLTPQLGFLSKLKRATKNVSMRSLPGDTDGGAAAASQDGPSAFEDKTHQRDEESALLLAREIDAFGSLVAFRLLQNSGSFLFSFQFLNFSLL